MRRDRDLLGEDGVDVVEEVGTVVQHEIQVTGTQGRGGGRGEVGGGTDGMD